MTNENETRRLLGLGLERAHARDEVAALGGYGFMIFANVLADDVKAPGRGEGEADGEAGHARGEHATRSARVLIRARAMRARDAL